MLSFDLNCMPLLSNYIRYYKISVLIEFNSTEVLKRELTCIPRLTNERLH